jgi:integrase
MKVELKYLNQYKDRRGNLKIYYRRNRKLKGIELTARPPGSPEFMQQYESAQRKHALELGMQRQIAHRSLEWLICEYKKGDDWKRLGDGTKAQKNNRFAQYLPRFGHLPIDMLDRVGVRKIRDEKEDAPAAANQRLKDLKAVFYWAKAEEIVDSNPVLEVEKLALKKKPDGTKGHRTWTKAEVARFLDYYPLGTKQHLAMCVFLYTGTRVSDACRLGPANLEDGTITFVEVKNSGKVNKEGETNAKVTRIPMLEPLRLSLEAYNATQKVIGMTWIAHSSGRSYNPKTISSWFVDQAKAAGFESGLTPHGIRKCAATFMADAGATNKQLMAVFGWKKMEQAELYTAAADAKLLAKEGLEKLEVTTENKGV